MKISGIMTHKSEETITIKKKPSRLPVMSCGGQLERRVTFPPVDELL